MFLLGSMPRWPFLDPVSRHVQLADLTHSISVGNNPVELYCLMMGRSLNGHDLMPCISLMGEMREDFHHIRAKPVLDHTFSVHDEEEVMRLACATTQLRSASLVPRPSHVCLLCAPACPTDSAPPMPCLSVESPVCLDSEAPDAVVDPAMKRKCTQGYSMHLRPTRRIVLLCQCSAHPPPTYWLCIFFSCTIRRRPALPAGH